MFHVVVLVPNHSCGHPQRDQVTGDNARVIILIGHNVFSALHKRRDDSLGSLKSRTEEKTIFAPDEFCETPFQLDMKVKRTGQVARTGAAGSILSNGCYGCFLYFGMSGKAKVVI
jgi:hypothetical protein